MACILMAAETLRVLSLETIHEAALQHVTIQGVTPMSCDMLREMAPIEAAVAFRS